MNHYGIITLFASLINFSLALFVLFKNPGKQINRSFALANLPLAFYNLSDFFVSQAANPQEALAFANALRFGMFLIPPTILNFTLNLTNNNTKTNQNVLKLSVILAFAFQILNLTPYFVKGIDAYAWGYDIVPGFIFYWFMVYFIGFNFYSVYVLWDASRISSGARKNQYEFSFAAFAIVAILSSVNFLSKMGVNLYPIGNISFVIYSIIMTYIIAKHRLMDIRIATRKLFYYSFSILYWIVFFLLIVRLADNLYILLGLVVIVALTFEPLRQWSSNFSGRIFASAFYYEKELLQLARDVFTMIDKERLINQSTATIRNSMKLESVRIIMNDAGMRDYPRTFFALHTQKKTIILEDLKNNDKSNKSLVKEIEDNEVEIVLPMLFQGNLIGCMLLGDKKNKELFTDNDLELLTVISNSLSIALINAQQFGQAKEQIDELSFVRLLGETVTSTIELPALAEKVLDLLRKNAANADRIFLLLFEENKTQVFMHDKKTGFQKSNQQFDANEFSFLENERIVRFCSERPDNSFCRQYKLSTCTAIPLNNESLLGVIFIETDRANINVPLYTGLSHQISAAIENARLYENLKKGKAQSENVLQAVHDGIITIGLDKNILTINSKAEKITGLRSGDVIGKPYSSVLNLEGNDLISGTLLNNEIYTGEESIIKIGDRRIGIRVNTEVMKDTNDQKSGVLLSIADLAEEQQLHEKVKMEETNIEYLSSLGKMALELSHKISNPLHIIKNYLALMRVKFDVELVSKVNDPQIRQFMGEGFETIDKETDKIVKTIDELKRSARPIEIMPEVFNIAAIFRKVIDEVADKYNKKGLEIIFNLDNIPEIMADKELIYQALFEIITQVSEDSIQSSKVSFNSNILPEKINIEIEYTTSSALFYQRERMAKEISAVIYTARQHDMGYGLRNAENIIAAHNGQKTMQIIQQNENIDERSVRLTISIPLKVSVAKSSKNTISA
ncbi:histidine kinase N-terminal 7TM domain-containing protein [Candidatus Margulisiibacteriota bacterium]